MLQWTCKVVFLFLWVNTQKWDSSSLKGVKNLHTVFHSGCTNVHSHQQCTHRIPFSLLPHRHLLFLVFFDNSYCIVVLICISLMITDVEHLFMSYTFWPFICFLWKNVCSDLLDIFNWICLLLSCISSLYVLVVNLLSDTGFANIFFHSVDCILFCLWFPLLCRSFLVWYCLFYFCFVGLLLMSD